MTECESPFGVIKSTSQPATMERASSDGCSEAGEGKSSAHTLNDGVRSLVVQEQGSPELASRPPPIKDALALSAQTPEPADSTCQEERKPLLTCSFDGCSYLSKTKKEMKNHKKNVHDYCRLCDIDFASWDDYHTHKIHSTEHIVCPICSADFRTQDGRNAHLRQVGLRTPCVM